MNENDDETLLISIIYDSCDKSINITIQPFDENVNIKIEKKFIIHAVNSMCFIQDRRQYAYTYKI